MLNEIYILDRVLEWFAMPPYTTENVKWNISRTVVDSMLAKKAIVQEFKELERPEFYEYYPFIISKLLKDRYIDDVSNELYPNKILYSITFEGKILSKTGGYVAIYEKEKHKKKIQILKDWMLIAGSWVAGIGTILLFVVELLKQFVWTSNH